MVLQRKPVKTSRQLLRVYLSLLRGKEIVVSFDPTRNFGFRNMVMRVEDVSEVAGSVVLSGSSERFTNVRQELRIPSEASFTLPSNKLISWRTSEWGQVDLEFDSLISKANERRSRAGKKVSNEKIV